MYCFNEMYCVIVFRRIALNMNNVLFQRDVLHNCVVEFDHIIALQSVIMEL